MHYTKEMLNLTLVGNYLNHIRINDKFNRFRFSKPLQFFPKCLEEILTIFKTNR